jgi:hypothetical protein
MSRILMARLGEGFRQSTVATGERASPQLSIEESRPSGTGVWQAEDRFW